MSLTNQGSIIIKPPNTPTIVSPLDGASVNLTPTLVGSDYSDPENDAHAQTHLRVFANNTLTSLTWEKQSSVFTSTTVPSGVLNEGQTYYWEIRYKDNKGNWSEYSKTVSFIVSSVRVTAIHSSNEYITGQDLVINCEFSYPGDNQLLSLLWEPDLPQNWSIDGVSGDGSPQFQNNEIIFTSSLSANPVKFNYTVSIPIDESGDQDISAQIEYQLNDMVNPDTVTAKPDKLTVHQILYHAADYRDNRWEIDGSEVNRVLAYWRSGNYHCETTGLDGYATMSGDISCIKHSADYREDFWMIDGSEVNRVLAYWRAGGYHIEATGLDGFASGKSTTTASSRVARAANSITAVHEASRNYKPESILTVTVNLTYSKELLSLLCHPQLPNGWVIQSVSGDGNPEYNVTFNEILWTSTLPSNSLTFKYDVMAPAGESGNKSIKNEIEYQFTDMDNPIALFSSPNPLVLNRRLELMNWKNNHFKSDVSNSQIAGSKADPDKDGIPNYLEYVLGLDPKHSDNRVRSTNNKFGMPSQRVEGNELIVTYSTPKSVSNISIQPQASSNLLGSDWGSGNTLIKSHKMIDEGSNYITREVRIDIQQLDKIFIRLEALEE